MNRKISLHLIFKLSSIVLLTSLLLSSLGFNAVSSARAQTPGGPQVIASSPVSISPPLSSLPLRALSSQPQAAGPANLVPLGKKLTPLNGAEAGPTKSSGAAADLSIVQTSPLGGSMPEPNVYFDGISANNNVLPPDTEGDIGFDPATGKKYYFQWVNLQFEIWDVTNPGSITSVYGPQNGNALFSGLSGICKTHNDGDPIVLFDPLADRWLASQFAYATGDFEQCIAVSTSADPLGSWYEYSFQISTTRLGDYPKFAVWPDGYYMTLNQFTPRIGGGWDWYGAGAVVFERAAMLTGASARALEYDLNEYGPGMLPATLTGPAPAPGTPAYFTEWDDAGSYGLGDPADTIRIWYAHTDWTNPANSTFGADAAHTANAKVTTTNVDPALCGNPNTVTSCIPQPGTSVKLDPISDRQMYRAEYRNFGSYQTLIGNHTVDANGADQAGIHWFELRNSGSGWGTAPYQEGVYAPADGDNRWMGSLAMDGAGDMALGYSVSSSTTYPSVRYTGRLATDTLGLMPQGEVNLATGGGSQTDPSSRWGDYSTMSVDPTDDCTFWYTQEYYVTTSGAAWNTIIGSFSFPTCANSVVNVTIAGDLRGGYYVPSDTFVSTNYKINDGPVHVVSPHGNAIFTSERAIFGTSFNSIVGYPGNQVTTDYWFTTLDDAGMICYLVIENPDPVNTALVDVYIGGNKMNTAPYSISPGQRVYPRYGINGGPVHVVSTNGVNIFTSERTKYLSSFNEVTGYPGNKIATDYWFTSLDDLGMITYLVIGNPDPVNTALVNVYISGNKMNTTPYSIGPGQRLYPRYGINGGPVHVVSTNGVKIFTSERSKYLSSFNEVAGYPGDQVATDIWFTTLDDASMITYLVIGNPDPVNTAQVDVYIGGNKMNTTPYSIGAGQRVFPRYGINGGPVHVVSTNGVKVFASERSKYSSSFNEILGIPVDQMTSDYWFTTYDNLGITTNLVLAAP